jgi:small subunit ribosomal protein S7
MSRRKVTIKYFPAPDGTYNSYLVNILISRIVKNGKKTLAQNIVNDTFDIIKSRLNVNPLEIFETAVRNVTPIIEVKAKRFGGATYQVPMEVNNFRGANLAIKWILIGAKKRPGKTMSMKLANELIDASNNLGEANKKKQETHRMAEANKAFAHFRY